MEGAGKARRRGEARGRYLRLERGNAVLRKELLSDRFVLAIFIFGTRRSSHAIREQTKRVAAGEALPTCCGRGGREGLARRTLVYTYE